MTDGNFTDWELAGDVSEIDVIAREPEYIDALWSVLTPERIGQIFGHFMEDNSEVERFYLPGSNAINFLMDRSLGGGGGVTTFSWSFRVRGKTPPAPKPFVRLTAPSGEVWTWNEEQSNNRIEGSAVDFSQVVTQCRNVGDTDLTLTGETAAEWMAHAQCFAGGSEMPPAQGTRHKVTS